MDFHVKVFLVNAVLFIFIMLSNEVFFGGKLDSAPYIKFIVKFWSIITFFSIAAIICYFIINKI